MNAPPAHRQSTTPSQVRLMNHRNRRRPLKWCSPRDPRNKRNRPAQNPTRTSPANNAASRSWTPYRARFA